MILLAVIYRMYDCKIQIFGDGKRVFVDHDCLCTEMDTWISDRSVMTVGQNSHFTGNIHLACLEGKTITIGKNVYSPMILHSELGIAMWS